jgi:hypothetical protein
MSNSELTLEELLELYIKPIADDAHDKIMAIGDKSTSNVLKTVASLGCFLATAEKNKLVDPFPMLITEVMYFIHVMLEAHHEQELKDKTNE